MGAAIVEFDRVDKRFRLGEGHDSLRDAVSAAWSRLVARRARTDRDFVALDGVSFAVGAGEACGVIGANGAGKSTVLKLLAGILRPDCGRITVRGRLAALIEVGAGFHGDLTGRENVYLNGAILGMTRAEVRRRFDAIVGFAGLERFIDTPVKRYSSGMYARLGFSVAAHTEPDVLLVDEVLSVGDAVFRLRCLERMRSLVRDGATLIFVTHDLDQMQSICPRAIVLDRGRVIHDGSSREAAARYLESLSHAPADRPTDLPGGSDSAVDVELAMRDATGATIDRAVSGGAVRVRIQVRSGIRVPRAVLELNLRAAGGVHLLSFNSARSDQALSLDAGDNEFELHLESLPLAEGHYFWNVRAWNGESGVSLVDTPFRFALPLRGGLGATGLLAVPHAWITRPASDETREARRGDVDPGARSAAGVALAGSADPMPLGHVELPS